MDEDKKQCCNKGEALEALDYVLQNKKSWALLLIIARIAPMAIVKGVAEMRPRTVTSVWCCNKCYRYNSISVGKCPECNAPRTTEAIQ